MLCENVLFLRILSFFNTAINVMRFAVPIILIVKTTLDVYHQILDVNDTSFKEKITKRIFAAVIVFLVPTMINLFLSFLETITNMSFNYSECTANIKNINYYVERKELAEKLAYEQENAESLAKYNKYLEELNAIIEKNKNNLSSDTETAMAIGKKYNLSDKEITNIAKVCQKEQGTAKGAAAEAELMINKYIIAEYNGSLYEYLFHSSARRWWHPIKSGGYSSVKLKIDVKEAVRKVVNEGYRTMPFYINEHDYHGDISKIVTNGKTLRGTSSIKNHSNYVKDSTVIYNKMGAVYTFYTFPDVKSDPFGYTAKAKEKIDKLGK